MIKPNCVVPKLPSTGLTTDSRVIDRIIDFVKSCGATDIIIGEGGSPKTDLAFDITGIKDVAARQGVKLVNFNQDEGVEVSIPSGKALMKVKISKTVLGSTCIINVPKLKIHHMTQVTLSIKNLMGVLIGDRGATMHTRIDEKLVDLASIIKPKLNIIDGLVGSEMDEVLGKPVPMNLIIAGKDIVATDVVGSLAMGVNPTAVRHIQMAYNRGLGVGDLDEIDVLGEPINVIKKKFSLKISEGKLKSYGLSSPIPRRKLREIWESQ